MQSGRGAFVLASGAVVAAAAFTAWALFAPAYSNGLTVLEANPGSEPVLLAPLAVACLVWLLLRVACSRDARWARTAALAIGWALFGFAILAAASIGMFVLPGAVLVLAAARLTPVASTPRAV